MRRFQDLLARVFDVALVLAGAAVASQIRFDYLAQSGFYWALVMFSAAFALAIFPAFGVYESWRGRSKLALAGQVSLAWLMVQACALVLMYSLHRIDFVSRLWFSYWTAVTGGLLISWRLITHAVLARARQHGMNLHQVAIVGSGSQCDAIIRRIESAPTTGFRAAAVYNTRPDTAPVTSSRVPVFGTVDALADYIRSNDVHELWLMLSLTEEPLICSLVGEFRDDLVNIRFMPDVRSLALFEGSGVIDLLGVPAINLVASPLSASSMLKKEIFDRLFAAAVLICLAPILLAIAIAVKLSSRGPVFFRQKRKGADGRVFTIYKFRSMRVHTEQKGTLKQATRDDPRVTKVGAFLRRTSLDELPQFFNVLRGDMSVVGPRPHALEHDDLYQKVVAGYINRYRIKPGITGWAQINGFRGETDRIEKMERRVEHDLYYLGHWSFALDMRIIGATIIAGLVHRNAY
ncbi:undecaprenyl-phosphate glucose phosphotransferase [Paraburkholderia sp. 22099]|jgi:Undecaprenyl-phosphate glucose phosphotransferase|uniref:Undecaprenyl-phosphate glucose phosphotransferase n=1 Tax=Paraburkholderia terricola TaxID=169427 RepID=A0A1M6MAK9_9BURK|nr:MULTISPECIES: undecaprenyl-phosphate glucose phosphotransferase [Paraburkholderia]AXE91433.1 undecaprenyl-phosphate glucose phosphotransferase [Paraburkholderia terricola]MDR6407641.1 Undecaprenyl-phosphate glucose phosphotransferase [Paraburkholderia terricola]MDR6444942.1 Undecaprenyl-phosphate glucose phosphotransferase [Paraburkholderia terricola]MDR6480143.1 Undecaprenyl-phosphate glucose phosphotransferase [Paraburkholderia terricola]MDR6492302.1 Undecaprenyl-phosphate glucose phospho